MEEELYKRGVTLVSICFPESFEEWREAVAAGYHVATTPEQRAEWGLPEVGELPVLSREDLLEMMFLTPGTPEAEFFDPTSQPEYDDELLAAFDQAVRDGTIIEDDKGQYVQEQRAAVDVSVGVPARRPSSPVDSA